MKSANSEFTNSRTDREKSASRHARPNSNATGLLCAEHLMASINSGCRESEASKNASTQAKLCKDKAAPKCVNSNTSGEESNPKQLRPKKNGAISIFAEFCDVIIGFSFKKSSAGNVAFSHARL